MASKLMQPTGFIKLTNVAFIKYKVDKFKFEIACYKNKAINWRNGVEKDINQVLQSEEIYENATHGTIAKNSLLKKAFPSMNKQEIIQMILEKGELQVSEKEREVQMQNLTNDIINFVHERIVHPESQRQFSLEQVTQAIQDIHFNVKMDQPAKKQGLICIQELQKKYNVMRAKMKLSLTFKIKYDERVKEVLNSLQAQIYYDHDLNEIDKSVSIIIAPNFYRDLLEELKKLKIHVTTEVVENNIINNQVQSIETAGDADLTVRKDWKEQKEGENDDDDLQQQQQQKKGKNKKQRQKEHKKLLRQQEEEEKLKKEQLLTQQYNNLQMQNMQQQNSEFLEMNNKFLQENNIQSLGIDQQLQNKLQHEQIKKDISEKKQQEEEKQQQQPKTGKKCTTCKEAYFDSNDEFRNHFKSEWHVQNVKRKVEQLPVYSEQEFQIALLDEQFMQQQNMNSNKNRKKK